jgi:ribokinase
MRRRPVGRSAPARRRGPEAGYPRQVPSTQPAARIVVLGDLVVDVVLAPATKLRSGSDVPGAVQLRQGGSAANTARWLGRLGARTQLICSVGRDASGRALVEELRADRVVVRAARIPRMRTGRIGVLVAPGGERSFVADRGAADALTPADLRASWFAGVDVLHLPAYSLLGQPLGVASRAAARLAREAGARLSVDLSSVGPLLAGGRAEARALLDDLRPDLVLATAPELHALVGPGGRTSGRALELAPIVVVKRGAKGATILARNGDEPLRFDVATRPIATADTTGAGDAFDAGFLVAWLEAGAAGRPLAVGLRRAALVGHRTAVRHLVRPRRELMVG